MKLSVLHDFEVFTEHNLNSSASSELLNVDYDLERNRIFFYYSTIKDTGSASNSSFSVKINASIYYMKTEDG